MPWLGIGIEYLRTNHLPLAMHYIKQAHAIAPHEPAVLHELGVLHYASGEYAEAAGYFTRVAEHEGDYDEARINKLQAKAQRAGADAESLGDDVAALEQGGAASVAGTALTEASTKIGRASCRERV